MTQWPPNYQDIFWQAYPRRLDKKKAMAKLEIIRKSGVAFSDIINGVEGYARYVQGTDPQFIKHPTTWLNGECWTNEYPAVPRSAESSFVAGLANVAARYGVTAGMGQAGDDPRKQITITLRAHGNPNATPYLGTVYRGYIVKPSDDSK